MTIRVPIDLGMPMIILFEIKVDPPTFDGVHNPKVFSAWLADMNDYFDWFRIS